MNKRFIGVLIFSFVVAASGGLITYRQLLNRPPAAKPSAPMNQIVMASRNIEAGSVLQESDLKLGDWSGGLPAGASSKVQDFLGRGVLTALYSKEPVVDARLAPKGSGGGLASMIPRGMRAFAVRVNEVVGVAGFAVPGMRVDVVINGAPPGASGTMARTLLQDVEVLIAGPDFKKDAEGKPIVAQVVTLLVSPDQAEKLSLAVNQTSIQLVLRNPVDRETAKVAGVAIASLFGEAPAERRVAPPPAPRIAAPAAPAPPPPFKMEIIQGATKTEASFGGSGGGK
jgi:pilus assembly protein CpaB